MVLFALEVLRTFHTTGVYPTALSQAVCLFSAGGTSSLV